MTKSHFCNQPGCIRHVFEPYLYCDQHQDKSSTPLIQAEVMTMLDRILPDWQHAKLTKVGFHEQRMDTIVKLTGYIMGGAK